MAALAEHPLVGEACLMGFDPDHAVAALVSFADTTTGGDSRKLTVQMHGDAFVNFLFSFQPAQSKQQQQQPLHTQNQQQQAPGRQQPQRGCKRSTPEADASESSECISLADSDFVAEGCVQSPEKPWTDSTHSRQRPQQPGKRLRRSCEAAPRPPAAAAAAAAAGDDLADDPAVQVAKHRRRVVQDSSSDGEGSKDLLRPAAAASAGGRADMRSRYQQAAAKAGRKSWPTAAAAGGGAEDLDCIITQSTPAFVGAAAGCVGGKIMPGTQQQTQQVPHVKQSQQKQKKAAAAAGTVPAGQSKLDRFFTPAGRTATATPAQQQQQRGGAPGRAAGPPATATAADASAARAVLSPLSLTQVTNSSRRSGSSFASLLQASAEGGPALLRTPAGSGYKTPAAGLRGPASLATPASGFSCGAGAGRQQQGQAAAVAPWWQPLTDAEADLDQYDLVNLKVFGHSSFRPAQKAIVQQAVQGRDLFVLMPTGGGKSLCYQLPAVMARGVTVVVCPLLSLMQDQVRALCQNPNGGIPATFLSSQQSESEAVAVKKELTKALPSVKLLYVTPEQLVKSNALRRILQRLCQNGLLSRFVIDEAHCVSTWGHDFRPDYKGLKVLRTEFKQTPITAVTATATAAVQADIISTLGITRTVTVHQTSFLRPNLLLKVVPKVREVDEDSGMPLFMVKLIQYIKNQQARAAAGAAAAGAPCIKQEQRQQQVPAAKVSCSGIVYCLSRKEAEGVAAALREQGGLAAQHYHAGMTPKQRTEVQNAFFSGGVQVIVATIAFGMGIDKPDVRFVVHFCLSKSLEGYYQEAGRAGRDGAPAECVLMYSPADINRHMHILRMSMGGSGSTHRFSAAVDQLETMRTYALNPDKTCRHAQLLEYFGVLNKDLPSRKCDVSCDVCRGEVVPLNPEEWTAADDGDGLNAEELDACIDLLEEDEEDEQQQQGQQDQQQQRSGGRRRQPLYHAAAGDGSGQDQAQGVMSEDDDSVEIVGSGSEGSLGDGSRSEGDSGDKGSSGSGSSSEGWDDEQEGGPGEACSPGNSAEDAGAAAVGGGAAAAGSGGSRQRGGNISRSHAGQQDSRQQHGRKQQQQQQHVRQQQQHQRVRHQQEQQQQQEAPTFQGFQKASQLQQQQQQQQPSRQQPPQQQAHQPVQQQQRQPQQGGFQRASDMQDHHQQQQQQPHSGPQRAAEQQQQHGQGPGQAGLGRGSSRFNRVLPASLSRLKPPQQQQQQQQPGLQPGQAAASGFDSAAALLQNSRGPSSSSSGRAAPASTAAASAAAAQNPALKASSGISGGPEGLAAPAGGRVGQWVTKKRLGMAGSNGSGGSRRPSPAEALARELQSAADDDIF